MKKLWIGVIMLVCFAAVVSASEGNVTVYSFKLWGDDDRIEGDWDDNSFRINSGKNIEIQLRYKNPYNKSVTIETIGTLYDIGNDIQRDEEITVGADERGDVIVFEYFIPADTPTGSYDYIVEFDYDFEGTNYVHEKEFEFRITKEEVNINEVLINITRSLADEKAETNELLSTVLNLSGTSMALGDCKSELGRFEQIEVNYLDYKDKYETEQNKSDGYMLQYTTCDGQRMAMYSQGQLDEKIKSAEITARRQQKKEDDNFLLMVVVGGGLWFYFKKKKAVVGGGGQGKPLTGTWK